jgi:hypothetical protein
MSKRKPPKLGRVESRPEYRLLIEPFSDPLSKRSGTLFLFRTTEEFQNFVYELVVEKAIKERKISFKIVGLRTPLSDFPGAGPALCRCEFDDLPQGEYTVLIDRRSKQANQFRISIHKKIKVLRKERAGRFIDVTADRAEWSLSPEAANA